MLNTKITKDTVSQLTKLEDQVIAKPDTDTLQAVGSELLDLASYDTKLGRIVDSTTTDQYIWSERYLDKYDGKRVVVEMDEDTGETELITPNTLINTIDDIIDSVKDTVEEIEN